jgi:PAS domain S-box-containing protein
MADPAGISPNSFRALWNASPDAMALTDAAGTVLAANPSFCALHGFPSGDLVGQNMAVTFPESARLSAMEHYHAVYESRDEGQVYPAALRWRDEAGRLRESRIDFITRGGRTSSMMSSVRVLEEEPTGAANLASRGSRDGIQAPEGNRSGPPFLASSSPPGIQTTPEVLVDAIQNWGIELVLGIPDKP